MSIKMIVTDLDRTLLPKDKKITDYSKMTFEKCQKKNIIIAIATARPIRAAIDYLDELKGNAAVYSNGALVTVEGKAINSANIEHADAIKLLNILKEKFPESTLAAESKDTLYTDFEADMPWEYKYIDFNNLPIQPIDKIIVGTIDINNCNAINSLLPDYLYAEKSSGKFVMIMHKNSTKHNGVIHLAEYYGISLDEVVAFGDDYNDVGMLRICGTGVAMADACEKAKETADYITATCDENGVADYISKFIL